MLRFYFISKNHLVGFTKKVGNQCKFPLLAHLAHQLICIPATSAPSERIFSSSGVTIAKDCTRPALQTVKELVFLHDAMPANREFEHCQGRREGIDFEV
jgi:hypothetical protein